MSEIIKWKELARLQRDALVAEHVIGLNVKIIKTGTEHLLLILDTANRPLGQVLPYTVELRYAWKVLEAIADDDDYGVRRRFLCAWKEHVNPGEDGHKQYNAFDEFIGFDNIKDVTPERICIAALRAKGLIIIGTIEETELDTQETSQP